MKEFLLVVSLMFTACLCRGEIFNSSQEKRSMTTGETPKQIPLLGKSLVSPQITNNDPVKNPTGDNLNNNHDNKEEKKGNLTDKLLGIPSNTTHSHKEDFNTGPVDEQDISILNAISVKVLVAQDHSIDVLDLSTTKRRPRIVEKDGLTVYSVDFHWNKSLVFFTANNSIYRTEYLSKQNVSSLKPIVSDRVEGCVRLAVDWVDDKLYWVSDTYQTIEMADLDGKNRRLVLDNIRVFKFPNNIAVDPFEKVLFFVSNFSLFKVDLNVAFQGKYKHVAVDQNQPGEPGWGIRNIALDRVNKKIFTTGKTPRIAATNTPATVFISKINYDGTDAEDQKNLLTSPTTWVDIYSLEVFKDTLYFTHFDQSEVDKIYELPLSTKNATPQLKFISRSKKNGIWSIRMFHPCVQLFPNSEGQCY